MAIWTKEWVSLRFLQTQTNFDNTWCCVRRVRFPRHFVQCLRFFFSEFININTQCSMYTRTSWTRTIQIVSKISEHAGKSWLVTQQILLFLCNVCVRWHKQKLLISKNRTDFFLYAIYARSRWFLMITFRPNCAFGDTRQGVVYARADTGRL